MKSELVGSSTFSLAFSRKPFTNWQPQKGEKEGVVEERNIEQQQVSELCPLLYLPTPYGLEALSPAQPPPLVIWTPVLQLAEAQVRLGG